MPSFYRASSYASPVFGHNSVRLSHVCHTRAVWQTKQCTADILIPQEMAITLVFWNQQQLAGYASFRLKFALKVGLTAFEKRRLRQMSTYNLSTVRDSERVQLWWIGSPSRAFQRAIDRVRTLPLTKSLQRVAQKATFVVFWMTFIFSRIKSAGKFLFVKTSSGTVVV